MTRSARRKALLIGIENYDDGRFARLPSARADIWQLRQVLEHRNIGAFAQVRAVADLSADDMRQEIGGFLDDCGQDELALLYVSGHGMRLVPVGGEFYFIAKDTDSERVAETGVGAGFVNEQLEQCVAPQKVVMIDSCRSGGFAVGLRTSDRPAMKSAQEAPLTSRGVYVLSSSRAGEDSYAGTEDGDDVRPSAFTAEVVEALRSGGVGRDGTGEVSVDDLFHYVNRRMRSGNAGQVPVKSALSVDDRIVIADSPHGRAPQLVPLTRGPQTEPGLPAEMQTPKTSRSRPTWTDLLTYYRKCVLAEETKLPLLSVADHGNSYVCLTGSERFLSGDLDDDHCAAMPPEAAAFVQALDQGMDLWAGYPAVVLHDRGGGVVRFAPLLVRSVEPVPAGDEVRLRPYGPIVPHPTLAVKVLGDEDAAALADTYLPSWHAGQHDRMAVDVRHLLEQEYELPFVQEPEPDRLANRIDIHTPAYGGRNAAILFAAPPEVSASAKLIKDFDDIGRQAASIRATALAALSPEPAERAEPAPEAGPVRLVTPLSCNESQAGVLRSAMTRRLTVATGPPGTGKSQLVANVVATAVAAGQRVLVASTNNQAVDEVCRRCEALAPSSVVRTGAYRYREDESAALGALRNASPPKHNTETARMRLDLAVEHLGRAREELAHRARGERTLLKAGRDREEYAVRLRLSVADLAELLPDPQALEHKAERAAAARLLGERRRRRLLRRLGIASYAGTTADACTALAGYAAAEAAWRHERQRATIAPDDDGLAAMLANAEAAVHAASASLLETAVRSAAVHGRPHIEALASARDAGGSDWPALKQVLDVVRGWAVTSLSARRFPPEPGLFDLVVIDEASQCSIPQVVPLLFRGRRALIIGDVMQLPHIATISPEREATIRRAAELRSTWLEKYRMAFRRHSAFHAGERATGGALLLDEHFRCRPEIAAFANHQFYNGRLTVLTDIRGRPCIPGRRAIIATDVKGRAERPPRGESWINYDESEKVAEIVRHLLARLPVEATVGVVTPFKAQADTIHGSLDVDQRLRVGTVHTFQGGERDVMVFSLVAGQGMHERSIAWVDRQLNMWNVAITRARSHLIVVGDVELWRRRGGVGAALLAAADARFEMGDDDGDDPGVELSRRLYRSLLLDNPGADVELGTTVNDHPCNATVQADGVTTAILLDPGPDDDTNAARHLRLMLRRRELLGDADGQRTATRLAAWQLYDRINPAERATSSPSSVPDPDPGYSPIP